MCLRSLFLGTEGTNSAQQGYLHKDKAEMVFTSSINNMQHDLVSLNYGGLDFFFLIYSCICFLWEYVVFFFPLNV